MFGVSLHDGGVIRDGGYVLELLLKCCVQSVCIESVFHREHYNAVSLTVDIMHVSKLCSGVV